MPFFAASKLKIAKTLTIRSASIQRSRPKSRLTQGHANANQYLGQLEAGYKVRLYEAAARVLTPLIRIQSSNTTPAGFTENGADSLNLTVVGQGTTSQRSTVGAEIAGTVGIGGSRKLDLSMRLGWAYEYAEITRVVTARFADAPAGGFTVFGATPYRDNALVSFSANATITPRKNFYLRYDGELVGTDNHVILAGLRVSW